MISSNWCGNLLSPSLPHTYTVKPLALVLSISFCATPPPPAGPQGGSWVVPLGCPLQPCSPTVNQTNSKEADPQIQPKEALSSSHSDQLSSLNPRSQTPRFMHFTFSFLFLSDQVHPDTCMQLSCKPAFLCQC